MFKETNNKNVYFTCQKSKKYSAILLNKMCKIYKKQIYNKYIKK